MNIKRAIFLIITLVAGAITNVGVAQVTTMPNAIDGVITLTDDVTLTETWTVDKEVTLDLNDHYIKISISGNSDKSVISITNTGKLTLKDGTIDNSTATLRYYIEEQVTDEASYNISTKEKGTFYGGYITGGNGTQIDFKGTPYWCGNGILINGGELIMKSGTIFGNIFGKRNVNMYKGGGVFIYNSGKFTMEGGNIIRNFGYYGSGIYVDSGTFSMKGGYISKNGYTSRRTCGSGGGVCVNSGKFIMTGGSIDANRASSNGAGVNISNGGEFEMSGGSIISNNTTTTDGGYGGGVYVFGDDNNGATFTMNGGVIQGNSSDRGGGVSVEHKQKAKFYLNGGEIKENHATYQGGGVYNYSGTFTITGGSITNNTVDNLDNDRYGGGIYSNYFVYLSGTCIIKDNTKGPWPENLFLDNTFIKVNNTLSIPTSVGVKIKDYNHNHPVTDYKNITKDYSTYNSGVDPCTFFTSDSIMYEVVLNSDSQAQLEKRKFPYAIWCENKKLYFTYRDDLFAENSKFKPEGSNSFLTITKVWSSEDVVSGNAPWLETISESLEEMVIESTFSNVKPTSCSQWFKDCANLTTITGLSNLNTSEITDISGMLQNCSSLESLTLGANFDTSGLNSYSNLFSGSSIADGNAVLTIDGATISQDDFFASITNGQLVRNVSDDEVDKGSANAGLYTWKGGKFVTYNGKALLTLGSTSNGSIAIVSGATAISGSLYEATPNTTITLSVTPDTRYKLKTLTYNDNDITNNSFDMPAGPVTVSATFIADFDPVDTTKDYDASTNPYAIRTVADLQKLSDYVNNGVEEVRDGYIKVVDVTELDFNGINDFVPIGTDTYPFTGSFDGNNVLIKNLKIDRGDADHCGLFGRVQMGSDHNNKALQNIKIDASCEFKTTGSHVGALAGHRESIKMINCHNLGASVSGTSFVGAIVGGGVLQANDSGNTYDGSLVVANINGTKYWGCGYGVGGNQETSSPSDYAQFTSTTIGGFYGAEGNEDQVTWRYDATTKTLLIKGTGSLASTTPWASYIGAATNNYTLNTDGIDLGTAVTQSDGYYVWFDKQFKYYNGRQQYKNTASVNEGGTMTVSPVYAEQGTTITLTPIAAVYSKLSSVNAYYKDDNGNQQAVILTSGADGTYTFTMPAYDISATATFGPVLSLADPSAACSRENPYLIRNVQDMVILSKATNGGASWTKRTYFKVAKANDVFDFEGIDFEPIGIATTHNVEPNERFNGNSFHSSFDGNGVTIRNLHISGVKGIGLFSELSANNDDYVENIFIDKSCSFTATNSYCGSIACNTSFTTVRNCHNLGAPVSAPDIAGGIVGHARYATITDCSSNASVSGTQNIGGIVGYIDRLPVTLTNNMVGDGLKDGETITITGKKNTGAIVGLDIYRGASYSNNLYNGEAVIVIFNGKTLTGSGYGLGMKPSDTNGIGAMTQVLSYTQQQEWATYYQTFDLTLPEGFEAFYVSSVSISGETGTVMLTSTGQKIYKKLPMLIRKTGNSTTVELTKETHSGTAPKTDERFKGTATDISNLSAEGKIIYVLRDGMFIPAKAGAMAANRCWIEVSKSAGTRGLEIKVAGNPKEGFSQEEENLEDRFTQEVDSWFDLQGRPLQGKPSKKGMYIHNGRKEVIK